MPTVFDVATYILEKQGPMTAMKLQKLVYYSQAWSLVWDDAPLFPEKIKAWANGPVCPDLYQEHKGLFTVNAIGRGSSAVLQPGQRETIDVVLAFYGNKTAQWLSDLTHAEPPWRDARGNLAPHERASVEIPHSAMAEYYGSLDDSLDAD